MQSFRQYKAFRKTLEGQIDRHKDRPTGAGREDIPQRDPHPEEPGRDLERGSPNGSTSSADTVVPSVVEQDHAVQGEYNEKKEVPQTDSQNSTLPHPTEEVEEPQKEEEEDGYEIHDAYFVPDSLEHRPSNLSRMSTQRSKRNGPSDLANMGTQLGTVMTGINIRKRNTQEGGSGAVFIVGYEHENDPHNPHNWSMTQRVFITITVASIGFVVGVASSIDSSATKKAAAEFGVSEVAEVCATGE